MDLRKHNTKLQKLQTTAKKKSLPLLSASSVKTKRKTNLNLERLSFLTF